METKRTDKQILTEGLKIMGITLALLILGPVLIRLAIINQEKPLYIPILIVGIVTCAFAIYFGFKGINTIMNSLFNKKD